MPPGFQVIAGKDGRSSGFTLIEVAVAVFIVALLAGSLLIPLVSQHEQRQVRDTGKMLAEAREALLGFAAANGYLPCPDITNDGQEDVFGSVCGANVGNLPAVTLGLQAQADPWGNRFRYRVEPAYAQRSPAVLTLSTFANVRVCISSVCPTKAQILTDFDPAQPPDPTLNPPGREAVAVILSHGKNGFGAIPYLTGASNALPSSADELANLTGTFVSRPPSGLGSPAGEFDDIVIWLGQPALFKVMIAAGRLP